MKKIKTGLSSRKSRPRLSGTPMLILFAMVSFASIANCQSQSTALCNQMSMIPGTVYIIPDGLGTLDSAWLEITTDSRAAQFFNYYIRVDSTLGYDSPCILTIEALTNPDSVRLHIANTQLADTMKYITWPEPSVIFSDTFFTVPQDTMYNTQASIPHHNRRRFRCTVTDSCLVTIKEEAAR